MSEREALLKEMQTLSEQIAYHAHLYHELDKPEIADSAYDKLVVRWRELEQTHPELAELFEIHKKPVPIHAPTGKGLAVVKMREPMLSLKKAHTEEEVVKFHEDVAEEVFGERKMDGLAIEFRYIKHVLTQAATRGDGMVGEDVTHAIPLIKPWCLPKTIPKTWPDDFSARGEIACSFEFFNLYNESAEKPRSTPRNAAAGWVRALPENQDKEVTYQLDFFMYGGSDNLGQTKYKALREEWAKARFTPAPHATLRDVKENAGHDLYPTDGIVFKVNSLEKQKELGSNNREPRWAIAYKFPDEGVATKFGWIDWKTGKTGAVNPTGRYNTVNLGGVSCNRATLHNYREFMELGLREDSVVMVSRHGDVIPQVDYVVEPGVGKLLEAPTECPSCGSQLELRVTKASADLYCNNVSECEAQLLARCLAFVHKRCLDIDGLGPVILTKLINDRMIEETSDILYLDRYAMTIPEKLLTNIKNALKQPMERAIVALGLPSVQLGRAKKLVKAWPRDRYPDILEWLELVEEVVKVPGFDYGLALPINRMLNSLDDNIASIMSKLEIQDSPVVITELKGCITGELGQSRSVLIDYFADNEIELVERVTKDCKFLIKGEKPSGSKVLKATEMKITIVDGTQMESIDELINHVKGAIPNE